MNANYADIVKTADDLMKAGNSDSAAKEYDRAIQCDASEPLAYVGLAATLAHQKKYEAAVNAAREGVARRPNFGRARRQLAVCLWQLADTCGSPAESDVHMDESLPHYETAKLLNSQMERIEPLEAWKQIKEREFAQARRIKAEEEKAARWDETRKRYRLTSITYGDTSDSIKATLAEEQNTDNGRRWRSEYYRVRR